MTTSHVFLQGFVIFFGLGPRIKMDKPWKSPGSKATCELIGQTLKHWPIMSQHTHRHITSSHTSACGCAGSRAKQQRSTPRCSIASMSGHHSTVRRRAAVVDFAISLEPQLQKYYTNVWAPSGQSNEEFGLRPVQWWISNEFGTNDVFFLGFIMESVDFKISPEPKKYYTNFWAPSGQSNDEFGTNDLFFFFFNNS